MDLIKDAELFLFFPSDTLSELHDPFFFFLELIPSKVELEKLP